MDRFHRYSHFYISQCLTKEAAILLILSRNQNRTTFIYRVRYMFCTRKQFKLITLYTSLYSFKREIKKQASIPPNYFAQCTRKENIILCQLRNSKSQLNGDLYQDHLSDLPNCIHCDCPETIDHFILKCPKYVNERIDLINSLITQPSIYENITICVNDLLFGNPNL